MKTITSLFVLALLVMPALAFPENIGSPDVCKITIDSGTSMSVIYAWQNPTTGIWEAKVGYGAYNGPVMIPITFTGNVLGTIAIDLTDMAVTTR